MRYLIATFAAISVALSAAAQLLAAGELTLTIVDRETKKPLPCRIHLRNEKERPQRAANMPFWSDHFVVPGAVKLKLPRGTYQFEIERGPEYVVRGGHFVMENLSKDNQVIDLPRVCNLADEGWWSGDLHVRRPTREIELLMQAEDLHVAAVSSGPVASGPVKKKKDAARPAPAQKVKQFDGNRYCDLTAGESSTKSGRLLLLNLDTPLSDADGGDVLALLTLAREKPDAWIDVVRPNSWDLPLWLALGRVDSIELCHDQFCRGQTTDDEQGFPRDQRFMPGATGIGRWTHEIYYHVLNCGFRIPPSAGSGSGAAANPVGYNRMYVWVDKDQFNYENWWQGFRLGRTFVTNGPLIRPVADGRVPGHVFRLPAGETLVSQVFVNFAARDTVRYFELIRNGRAVRNVRYEDISQTGRFPPVEFDASGWFLIRAVAEVDNTFRFATSAPWYVEIGDDPKRISRASVQFFLDWLNERVAALAEGDFAPEAEKAWADAKSFWEERLAAANAD